MTTAIFCCLLVIACLVAVQTGILLLLCAKVAWAKPPNPNRARWWCSRRHHRRCDSSPRSMRAGRDHHPGGGRELPGRHHGHGVPVSGNIRRVAVASWRPSLRKRGVLSRNDCYFA